MNQDDTGEAMGEPTERQAEGVAAPASAVDAAAAPDAELPEGEGAPASETASALRWDGGPPPPESKKVRKSKRRTRMRAKTIAMKRLTKEEIRLGALLYPPEEVDKPKTRAECMTGQRPCPFISCKHHLYLDVNPETGSIKLNFPDLEVWEMKETCSLDVADRGGVTLEEVGEILNLTRERIRQVEVRGLLKLKLAAPDMTIPAPRNDNGF
jgi:hypothetical protein